MNVSSCPGIIGVSAEGLVLNGGGPSRFDELCQVAVRAPHSALYKADSRRKPLCHDSGDEANRPMSKARLQ